MDLELSSLGVRRFAERLISGLCLLIERMVFVVGIDTGDFAGADEAGDIVDSMFVKVQAAASFCLICGKGNADRYILKS